MGRRAEIVPEPEPDVHHLGHIDTHPRTHGGPDGGPTLEEKEAHTHDERKPLESGTPHVVLVLVGNGALVPVLVPKQQR